MKRFSSLKFRIVALISVFIIIISIMIIQYNSYILNMRDEEYAGSIRSTLSFSVQNLSSYLNNIENYLLENCVTTEEVYKMGTSMSEVDRLLAQIQISEEFRSCMGIYTILEGLFLYNDIDQTLISQSKSNNTQWLSKYATMFLEEYKALKQQNQRDWFFQQIGKEYYMIKVYQTQTVYVAAYIRVADLVDTVEDLNYSLSHYVVMCNANGNIMDSRIDSKTILLRDQEHVTFDGIQYRNYQVTSKNGQFSLCFLQEVGDKLNDTPILGQQVLFVAVFVVIISIIMVFVIRKLFNNPINQLVFALNQIKEGNLDVNFEDSVVVDEFRIVHEAVTSMTKEIKDLKISVYEETINKQKVELLYLQEQINPHFLTNCMNLIRNLAYLGETEKVQTVAILFSKYTRYSLRPSTMNSLKREIEHVENYIELQKMFYGELIELQITMEEYWGEKEVPTMLLQSFVENSVKYQMDFEKGLVIRITVTEMARENREGLLIEIADNGDGFAEETLEILNQREIHPNEFGEHIGIHNVCQRLEIIYKGNAKITFGNAETGGAEVRIWVPLETIVGME